MGLGRSTSITFSHLCPFSHPNQVETLGGKASRTGPKSSSTLLHVAAKFRASSLIVERAGNEILNASLDQTWHMNPFVHASAACLPGGHTRLQDIKNANLGIAFES